ncbi:DUF4230 domain-containing protein [bacterium]|nr:MAG: DUF4230 domain-containing protein [bacterium]
MVFAPVGVSTFVNRRRLFPWVLSGALGLALLSVLSHRGSTSTEVPTSPVLQRLRALGDLHTARFEYSDVVNHGTYQKPEGMLAAIPGVDSMARAATENKALIDVRGSVEAGVDLRKLAAENTPMGLRIVLPSPRAYAPQVDARLFSVRHGLFWRDEAITLSAVEKAKERLADAAIRQGLLKQAQAEAANRVRGLAETFGAKVAEVRFDEA